MTGNKEDSTAALGDSEIPSIKHPEESQIPAFGKTFDDCFKVFAIIDRDEIRHIFKYHPSGLYFSEDAYDFKEEAAPFSRKPRPLLSFAVACCADVLARKEEKAISKNAIKTAKEATKAERLRRRKESERKLISALIEKGVPVDQVALILGVAVKQIEKLVQKKP